jgi:hypothetical protein
MKRLLIAVSVLAAVPFASARAGGPGACLGPEIAARAAFGGATGAQEGGVILRNRSGHSCLLTGRATVDFAVRARAFPLPVLVTAGRATNGRRRDRTLALLSGQRAFVHVRWSNWCGERYERVTVRVWLMSVEPRVHVRGSISSPRCDHSAAGSQVAVGPYERLR